MAALSAKNQLQEICTAHKWAPPSYQSFMEGPSHAPSWRSTVMIRGNVYSSGIRATRVAAEISAAELALEAMSKPIPLSSSSAIPSATPASSSPAGFYPTSIPMPTSTPSSSSSPPVQWIVLIDVENIQPDIDFTKPVEYHLFKSDYSVGLTNKYDLTRVTLHTIDSAVADAADHLLTYWAGKYSATRNIKQYVIVSRDKFSSATVSMLKTDGNTVLHFKHSAQFVEFLDSL